jgi:hypothetical protein
MQAKTSSQQAYFFLTEQHTCVRQQAIKQKNYFQHCFFHKERGLNFLAQPAIPKKMQGDERCSTLLQVRQDSNDAGRPKFPYVCFIFRAILLMVNFKILLKTSGST